MILGLDAALAAAGAHVSIFAGADAGRQLASYGQAAAEPLAGEDWILACARDLLIVGTSELPGSVTRALTKAARAAGIPTLGLVDMPVNAEFRFRDGAAPLGAAPDRIAAPDQLTLSRFAALGFARDALHPVRHQLLEHIDATRCRFAAMSRPEARTRLFVAGARSPVVVFASESQDMLNPGSSVADAGYGFTGRGGQRGRTAIVMEEVIDACRALPTRVHLVARLAPKNARDEFPDLLAEFDQVSQGGDPAELLWAADATIGMTSMILSEAAALGCAVLSVLPRREESEWLAEIATGVVPAVFDRNSLRRRVAELLERPVAPVARPLGSESLAELILRLTAAGRAHADAKGGRHA